MKTFLKISAICLFALLILVAAGFAGFFIITKNASLDEEKLLSVGGNIAVFDADGAEIAGANLSNGRKSVEIENLQRHTIEAFIASEDRNFYNHNGLNFKRILKAAYKNMVSRSFKEGASTISQQLIKNTHLSGDKTISRKLNEIKLTLQLEKKYPKDEILEMYLSTIYFGHNCFGLESAAEFYFDKSAENLSLEESAVLVGLLASPNNYSPYKNPLKSAERRNLVLKAMRDCGYITQKRCEEAINSPINLSGGISGEKYGDYLNAAFEEIGDIFTRNELTDGCKIYTYLNRDAQDMLEETEYPCDYSVIITENSGKACAFKSNIGNARRQPGSTIKPLAVYAPAIEEKLLSPYTRINDEKIDFAGYSPENADKRYHGQVTVADCIKMSYNVPAVKTLNSLTLEKSEKYLNKMGITLGDNEKNLSLALGGMENGMTLKQIADCYTAFANSGLYSPSRFIKKIVDGKGRTVYEDYKSETRVFSEGTCSLMNEMLAETSKSGTAKKLKNLSFDVASKTGTCGNEEGNTDAYTISYTSKHTIGVWLGDKQNNRLSVTGGKDCCEIAEKLLSRLYFSLPPENLEKNAGTSEAEIDAEEYYKNDKTVLADDNSPKLNILKIKTLKGNEPKEKTDRFTHPKVSRPQISVKNDTVNIQLCQTKYYSYLIKRTKNGTNTVIFDGKWKDSIIDKPEDGIYTYTVLPYYSDGTNKFLGEEIILSNVKIGGGIKSPQTEIPDIAKKDWYDL